MFLSDDLKALETLVRLGLPHIHNFAVVRTNGARRNLLGPHLCRKTDRMVDRMVDRRQGATLCGMGYFLATCRRDQIISALLPEDLCETCIEIFVARGNKP